MLTPSWSKTRRRTLVAAVSCAFALGCSGMLGPPARPTASVRGRLHAAGQSLAPGWVEFWPVEGTVGTFRSARLALDGTFATTRVPVGRVLVRYVPAGPPASGGPRLDARAARCLGFDSPIRLDVTERPDWLDIDVAASWP